MHFVAPKLLIANVRIEMAHVKVAANAMSVPTLIKFVEEHFVECNIFFFGLSLLSKPYNFQQDLTRSAEWKSDTEDVNEKNKIIFSLINH